MGLCDTPGWSFAPFHPKSYVSTPITKIGEAPDLRSAIRILPFNQSYKGEKDAEMETTLYVMALTTLRILFPSLLLLAFGSWMEKRCAA